MDDHGISEADAVRLKTKESNFKTLTNTWYAACQAGHAFWAGPDRGSYDQAQNDATAHDKGKHNGSRNAVVLND